MGLEPGMVNTFDTIEILYDRRHKDISGYLAEFFKLCGLFVVEKTEDEFWGFDDAFDEESEQEEIGNQKEADVKIAGERQRDDIPVAIDIRGRRNASWLLQNVLNVLFNKNSLMEALFHAYEEHNLFVHNMLERYYYSPTKERVKNSHDVFKKVYEQLDKVSIYDESWGMQEQDDAEQLDEIEKAEKLESCAKYFEYFKISCKTKMNNLCDVMNIPKDFSTESLIRAALQLTEDYAGFYQGQVLAGLIADKDIKYVAVSREYYNAAMDSAPKMFRGYLHYRLARYYEKTDKVNEIALRECENALEILPENIRIVYKKGIMEYRLGFIGEACRDFMQVCDLLSDAVTANCMEPIELEYLSKSYTMLHIIYSLWLKEKGNARIVAEMIQGMERIVNQDVFFVAVFGNEAQSERELLKEHMRSRKVDLWTESIKN